MEVVCFVYNGSNEVVATINNAVPTRQYVLAVTAGSPSSGTAVSDTLTLTVSDVTDPTPAVTFECEIVNNVTNEVYGTTVLSFGSTAEFPFHVTWGYDGVNTVTAEASWDLGVDFVLFANGPFGFADTAAAPVTGTGALQTITLVSTDPPYSVAIFGSSGQFEAGTYDNAGNYQTVRLFIPGVANAGTRGSNCSPPQYQRIYGIPVEIDDNGVETVRELIVGIVGAP